MGGTIASLSEKGIETTELVESEIRQKRFNLFIAVLICIIVFIAISYGYMSNTWLWITIPIFIITLTLLSLTEIGYWNFTKYSIPTKMALETTEVASQLV